MRAGFAFVFAVLSLSIGCRQNDDPDGAKALYEKASADPSFKRAPGYPERTPSFTAHSREVDIWVNDPIVKALEGRTPVREWPVGSIVKKEGFSGGKRQLVALMEKRDDGWYWAEVDGEGEALWSATNGKPDICVECHDNRAKYSDWVYSFEFPR